MDQWTHKDETGKKILENESYCLSLLSGRLVAIPGPQTQRGRQWELKSDSAQLLHDGGYLPPRRLNSFHPDGHAHAPLPQLGAAHSSRMQGPSQYLIGGNVLQPLPLCTVRQDTFHSSSSWYDWHWQRLDYLIHKNYRCHCICQHINSNPKPPRPLPSD